MQAILIALLVVLLILWIVLGQKKPGGILGMKVGHATLIALLLLVLIIRLGIRDPHIDNGAWAIGEFFLIDAILIAAVLLHAKYWPRNENRK